MSECVVREVVDGLRRALCQLLKYVELSAAYPELLLDGATRNTKTLDYCAYCIHDPDHICAWPASASARYV
jgi:hypothetical protein